MPVKNTTGKNTTTKVIVDTSTGIATSCVPSSAASIRPLPIRKCRVMLSSTTMD